MREQLPLIIEAAINEQARKSDNPFVPYAPEDIVADALSAIDAGATIVHFHARDEVTGDMLVPGIEPYAAAMRVILKERPGVLVYPTYGHSPDPADRWRHVAELAKDPDVRLPFMTLDPGWADMTRFDVETGAIGASNLLSVPHDHCTYQLELCRKEGVRPSFVVRELGHMRSVAAYHRIGLVEGPILVRINLSDHQLWGAPPSPGAIQAYLDVVPKEIPLQWMAYTYGTSHWAMNLYAISAGGHVRTGLGDNPIEPDGTLLRNADKVARVVDAARIAGRPVATFDETRVLVGAPAFADKPG